MKIDLRGEPKHVMIHIVVFISMYKYTNGIMSSSCEMDLSLLMGSHYVISGGWYSSALDLLIEAPAITPGTPNAASC